jgi:flagellar biosynthesis chaperone FliJ
MEKIDGLLQNYQPGDPSNKPDVLKQIKEIEEERKSMSAQQNGSQGQIVLNQNGQQIVLNNDQIVQIIQKQQEQLQHFAKMLEDKDKIISGLESQLEVYKIMNEKNNSIIQLLQKTNN